ncbi:MAG: hypothetical protein M3068_14700 [Gemmatimonadota bacterium]|nr:hypothetical protein [Gemmatimonadota bacterium]
MVGASRALFLLTAATILPWSGLSGQQKPRLLSAAERDTLQRTLQSLGSSLATPIALDSVRAGPGSVRAGEQTTHDVVVRGGNLDIFGTVMGNAIAIQGDVVLHPGGLVRGDAVSLGGRVRGEGGTVAGETRVVGGALTVAPGAASAIRRTRSSLLLVLGQFGILAAIGFGVVLFAPGHLKVVADTIRDGFTRAFLIGLLGQLAFLPLLILGIVALAITVIGILLIPFAVIASVMGGIGILVLAFHAVAYVGGEGWLRHRGADGITERAFELRALLLGIAALFVLWIAAGALVWAGWLGIVVRVLAMVVTWVAITTGAGATLLSRGGTRRVSSRSAPPVAAPEDYSWQTPTPVSGVSAARRPTPSPRSPEL